MRWGKGDSIRKSGEYRFLVWRERSEALESREDVRVWMAGVGHHGPEEGGDVDWRYWGKVVA